MYNEASEDIRYLHQLHQSNTSTTVPDMDFTRRLIARAYRAASLEESFSSMRHADRTATDVGEIGGKRFDDIACWEQWKAEEKRKTDLAWMERMRVETEKAMRSDQVIWSGIRSAMGGEQESRPDERATPLKRSASNTSDPPSKYTRLPSNSDREMDCD